MSILYTHQLDFKQTIRTEMNESRAKNKGVAHYKKFLRDRASNYTKRTQVREFIFKRDNYKCVLCGSGENLQVDHIISVYKGGQNRICNLQTLCISCNAGKPV
jgi:5-methylcytosine-specific restriction enzyme A